MNINKLEYQKYAKAHAPKSPILKDCLHAFFVGGAICALGEGLLHVYTDLCRMDTENGAALVSVTLIFLSILLTAIGIYDNIAKFAGAGTLVPITGFANSVASPAIDSKSEGLVLGVGAKIFTVAGPVLLYGTLAGAVYGLVYWLTTVI